MEKETDNKIIENSKKKDSTKKNNISEDDFWNDKMELNIDFTQYNNINNNINISTPNNHNKESIIKDNLIKDPNVSIIIKKVQKMNMNLNNYYNIISKSSKKNKSNSKIKLHYNSSMSNIKSSDLKNERFSKLYEEGIISMKRREEQSMEAKIKKENEYKKYSYSPLFIKNKRNIKNNGNKKEGKKDIEKIKKEEKTDRIRCNDIYERNKLWKKTIEDKNTKQRLLEKKKTETNIKFKPAINDCIMKTDEDFINKNSIEYQAFIDKINFKKNKENIFNVYGKNQRNNIIPKNNIKTNKNKTKNSFGIVNKKNVNNNNIDKIQKINQNKEMKKLKSFNNRNIFNINNCRKQYGLSDFFNSNYDTLINNDNDKDGDYINGFLSSKKVQDYNELYFRQDIFNHPVELKNGIKQTYFTFNDALLKK
jgi:hypothetical protein